MVRNVIDALAPWGLRLKTQSMEFVRNVYGSSQTSIQIICLYVCDKCGCSPLYDLDWYLFKKAGDKSGSRLSWFCSQCGRYGRKRLDGLRQRCAGHPAPSGKTALTALGRGLHPVKQEGEVVVMRAWGALSGGGRALGS